MRWETLASDAKAKSFFLFPVLTKGEYEGWFKLRLHPAILPTTPNSHKPTEAINQRERSKPVGHDRWAFISWFKPDHLNIKLNIFRGKYPIRSILGLTFFYSFHCNKAADSTVQNHHHDAYCSKSQRNTFLKISQMMRWVIYI